MTAFNKHKITIDGLSYKCRACSNARSRQWTVDNRQLARARSKAHREANPERAKAAIDRWNAANKDRLKECAVVWQAENAEKVREIKRAYVERHPEKRKESCEKWRIENPAKCAEITMRRYTRQKQACMEWRDAAVISMYYECAAVLSRSGVPFQVDHVVPIQGEQVCGLHTEHNLQILPRHINVAKSNKFVVE